MASPFENRRAISRPEHVKALASPIRQELLDTLTSMGGLATAASLAEQLGRHADGLYYHLRLLAEAGLVVETAAEGGKHYRLAGSRSDLPPRLEYRRGKRGNTAELPRYADAMLKVAKRDFDRAVEAPGVQMRGPRRELWASRNKGWVSPDDLEEINRLLERLSVLTSQVSRPERDLLVSLMFVLAPLPKLGKRRGARP